MLFEWVHPDVVINLAASLGGIACHTTGSSQIIYDNLKIGLEVAEAARMHGVSKFVHIGTSCSYPEKCPSPLREEYLWQGFPNEATAPYGVAKLALMLQAQVYRKEQGFPAITLIPANVYGPRDIFDPVKSHVIPALIMKAVYSKVTGSPFVVWGTGQATREFVYVTDVAEAIVRATESYDEPEPLNIGTGVETSMFSLARDILELTECPLGITFDKTKPEGCTGRVFDVSRAKTALGFEAKVGLNEGLKKTVDWYNELRK
jgi:nucleoside-diphosphate-sugar epimerase